MNKNIGIFFGTDTGNTEYVATLLQKEIGSNNTDLHNIMNSSQKDFERYNYLLLGISTWFYGEAQSDWNNFFPILQKINFNNKTVALFGCGDQEDYGEYFCDAMRILYDIIIKKNAKIIGFWSNNGYYHESSKALINNQYFVGLTIDEDRQPELTEIRSKQWIHKLKLEI